MTMNPSNQPISANSSRKQDGMLTGRISKYMLYYLNVAFWFHWPFNVHLNDANMSPSEATNDQSVLQSDYWLMNASSVWIWCSIPCLDAHFIDRYFEFGPNIWLNNPPAKQICSQNFCGLLHLRALEVILTTTVHLNLYCSKLFK